jgi:hypothetical protein
MRTAAAIAAATVELVSILGFLIVIVAGFGMAMGHI